MDKKKKANAKKCSAPQITDLDVEQRKQALLKQKHCDAVALHIVGKLIDAPVEEDVFLQCLKYLNQCHYQDIVEERAISKLCGYPLCANSIPDLPNQKYHISSRSNKVYDVTDRKNYCSNFCYTAGSHIKTQMLTSPLWFRDQEIIPEFKLLSKTEKANPGEEIDQGVIKVPKESDPEFTSVSQFTQDVLNDIPDDYDGNDDSDNDIRIAKTSRQNRNSVKSKSSVPISSKYISDSSKIKVPVTNSQIEKLFESSQKEKIGSTSTSKCTPESQKTEDGFTEISDNIQSTEPVKNNNSQTVDNDRSVKTVAEALSSLSVEGSLHEDRQKMIGQNSPNGIIKSNIIDNQKSKEKNINIFTDSPNNVLSNNSVISTRSKIDFAGASYSSQNCEVTELDNNNSVAETSGGDNKKDISNCIDFLTMQNEENFFYSKMFAPSLIDILQENSKYFENVERKLNEPKLVKSIDEVKPKSILSKKGKEKIKKSVSFSSGEKPKTVTSLTEESSKTVSFEPLPPKQNRVFKKPVISQNMVCRKPITIPPPQENPETIKINHKKNIPEDSLINKPVIEHKQIIISQPQKPDEPKPLEGAPETINLNHKKNITKNSLINKPIVEHKPIIISQPQKTEDTKKQTRKLNLRNSATFARAKSLSNKPQNEESHEQTNNQNIEFKTKLNECLKEWLTIDTMIFLHGEEKVKKVVSDKTFKEYLNAKKNSEEEAVKKRQYDSICRRLNIMELADKQFDESIRDSEKKPIPNFEQLKEEAETMDLRVRAFYSGMFEIYEEDAESEVDEDSNTDVESGAPAVMPLVDNKDYAPLRKKIFLTSLSRMVPKLCEVLDQSENCLMHDLKELVDTFTFTASNIIFKTIEWPVVAMVLVQMLSRQNIEYRDRVQNKKCLEYTTIVIKPFSFMDLDSVDKCITKVIDMQQFLQGYLQKTNDVV